MLDDLKQKVYDANMLLVKYNLVILTWGNVSGKSDDGKYIVIKPSGIEYNKLTPENMVVTDMSGNVVEGKYSPSSDTLTHLELYKAFPNIKGICHTHSSYATSFAQTGKPIECFGTTHADYFCGSIPCTRELSENEINNEYEQNTGKIIVETFSNKDYEKIPCVLVNQHGVFAWGTSPESSVINALVAENTAKMNLQTLIINSINKSIHQSLLSKHYNRKNGINAYYGQK